jgi:hypothetical protein
MYSGFQAGVNTSEIIIIIIIIIPYGGINSRMTSYLKISVLIDFPFEDAIFPFNRGTAT